MKEAEYDENSEFQEVASTYVKAISKLKRNKENVSVSGSQTSNYNEEGSNRFKCCWKSLEENDSIWW